MTKWQATFLGLKRLPRELSGFEIEAFFTFTLAERQLIEERRRPALKLGLALQIGFLLISGRLFDSVRIVPPALCRHLGEQFGVQAPDLASLRGMYRRHRTVYEHQELACTALGLYPLTEARRRALVYALREELTVTLDRMRLLAFGRQWLYDRQLLVMREKDLRAIFSGAIRQFEAKLVKEIRAGAGAALVERWHQALVKPRESSLTTQSWLWAPPATSTRPGKLRSCWNVSRYRINWMCSTTYEIIPMTCCVGMRGGWRPARHRQAARSKWLASCATACRSIWIGC